MAFLLRDIDAQFRSRTADPSRGKESVKVVWTLGKDDSLRMCSWHVQLGGGHDTERGLSGEITDKLNMDRWSSLKLSTVKI